MSKRGSGKKGTNLFLASLILTENQLADRHLVEKLNSDFSASRSIGCWPNDVAVAVMIKSLCQPNECLSGKCTSAKMSVDQMFFDQKM